MKRLIIWLGCMIALVIAFDIAFGHWFDRYMAEHTLPGDYEITDHVLRDFDDDIVVLGSSVALNGINTRRMADSLGIKAFNGGANGQAFPFYLTMLKAIVGQKVPEHVILGLLPGSLEDTGAGVRYNFLAPYYGRNIADIDRCLAGDDAAEQMFLNSGMYRMNRIWFRIFLYNFISAGIKGENGFIAKPLPPAFPERISQDRDVVMSEERRMQLKEFVELCHENNIVLTVVFTPQWLTARQAEESAVREVRDICGKYGYRVFDDSVLAPFDSDSTLFYDNFHINIIGSDIYTDTLINRLRP